MIVILFHNKCMGQKRQISSYKMSKSWTYNRQHGDYS